MDLGEHFKDSPVICFEGNPLNRAEDLADTILPLLKTHCVWGYSLPINGPSPKFPEVYQWGSTREDLIKFICTHGKNCHIAFIVFGKYLSPNDRDKARGNQPPQKAQGYHPSP